MKNSLALVFTLCLAHGAMASDQPLDANGNPIVIQNSRNYRDNIVATSCKCEDGRVFHLKDELIDLYDANGRWKISSITARMDYSNYAAASQAIEHPELPAPLLCSFDTAGTTIDTAKMGWYADYKLERKTLYSFELGYRGSDATDLCRNKRLVADPRLKRKYDYHPQSGDQLIIGRDDPDAVVVGNKIETDNKEVSLDDDIIHRMTSDSNSSMPTLFPRIGEVVVANRVLEVTDSTGKKHKVAAGTPGIVTKREQGSIAVNLFFTKNPNVLKMVTGLRLSFPCRFGEYCPTLTHPEPQRMSFDSHIKEGDFVGADEYLQLMAQSQNMPTGVKK